MRFNSAVGEDEIDLESGFLVMPQSVPVAAPPVTTSGLGPTSEVSPASGGELVPILTSPSGPPGTTPSGLAPQTAVEISFSADRNQLFSAWNAIANLADLAGKVSVRVRAESAEGFDKGKLQNGVLEPLRESDLIE